MNSNRYLVKNLRLGVGEDIGALRKRAAKVLKIKESDIKDISLVKRSLDARKKNDIHYVCSAAVTAGNALNAELYEEIVYGIPKVSFDGLRPVIAGFGPAGMFAGLVLSKAGLMPLILERGGTVEERTEKVEAFRKGEAPLDAECNVQFGEGGAGTFSDGKLNTGTHDSRISWVLRQFYEHGAQESILYDAKPHIGTDILCRVVKSIREDIISNGGEILFNSKLESINIKNGSVCSVTVSRGDEKIGIPCEKLILATGHSSRDTFEMLKSKNVPMARKGFSMGVRVEHRQEDVNASQYGEAPPEGLPAADYSANAHFEDGTSAYTFCMCPGGKVIAAASEEGGVCTNGMSDSKRDAENANSAILVTLSPEDFPGDDVLAGVYWQREIERKAYLYAGKDYKAPVQKVGDFLDNTASTGPGRVRPSYEPGVYWGDIRQVLPARITEVLEKAIPDFSRRLAFFRDPDAVLTCPEARSSSPVRILRDENCESGLKGLYPCGEGAGYAGGITSAAVDGMRCAEKVILSLLREKDV